MHNIENEKGTLTQLLQTVRERHNRSADFLTSTNNLVKTTDDDGKAKLVIEQNGGEPTRILDINEFTQGQIAQAAEIDTRTARRLHLERRAPLLTAIQHQFGDQVSSRERSGGADA